MHWDTNLQPAIFFLSVERILNFKKNRFDLYHRLLMFLSKDYLWIMCALYESRVTELTESDIEKKIQDSSNGHFGLKGDRA